MKPRHAVLVARMRDTFPGLTTVDAVKAVDQVFTAVRGLLEDDEKVRIPGFGTFTRKFVDTRQVRNPRTGETSTQLAHHVTKFRGAKR